MRNLFVTLFFVSIFLLSFVPGLDQDVNEIGQEIKYYSYEQLEPLLNKKNDTTYVVNFWASWCTPCLEEMPAFEKVRTKYKDEKFKLLLVSLDFPDHVESRLVPTIIKHKIKAEVVLLDDPDANSWISKIHPDWSGAIPATLVYNASSKKFYERSFTYEELDDLIKLKLK